MDLSTVAKDEDEYYMQQRFMQAQLQSNLLRMRENSSAPKLTVVPTNEVEERQRYRHQWKSEDRQRFLQERLELFLAIITGLVLGLFVHGFSGLLSGAITGLVIWFMTGLFRHWSTVRATSPDPLKPVTSIRKSGKANVEDKGC